MGKVLLPNYAGFISWDGNDAPAFDTLVKFSDGREVSWGSLVTQTNGDAWAWLDESINKHLWGQHDQATHAGGKGIHDHDESHKFWGASNPLRAKMLKASVSMEIAGRMKEMGITSSELRATMGTNLGMDRWDGKQPIPSSAHGFVIDESNGGFTAIYVKQAFASDLVGKEMTYEDFQTEMSIRVRRALGEDAGLFYMDINDPNPAIDRAAVSRLVHGWAETSNNAHPASLAMQEVAKDVFGLQDTAGWKFKSSDSPEYTKSETQRLIAEHGKVYGAFLQAQYAETQDFFKAQGISELTLYRGVRSGAVKGFYPQGFGKAMELAVQTRPLSSWTSSLNVAFTFATKGGDDWANGRKGYVMQQVIPIERILSTPFTGLGCLSEHEIVTLGGQENVRVAEAFTRDGFRDMEAKFAD